MIDYSDWFIQLWRPVNPTACCLQAGKLGNLVTQVNLSPRTRGVNGVCLSPVAQELQQEQLQGSEVIPRLRPKAQEPAASLSNSRGIHVQAQAKGAHFPFLDLFVLFRPLMDWAMPTHTDEDGLLYRCTYSDANLLPKHPHSHTQNVLPSVWTSLIQGDT